jgi:ferrous iron transport protein A
MNNEIPLTEVKPGESHKVIRIIGGYGMIRKLHLMGIKEGKVVKKVSFQPMRGPVVIEIGGSQVAVGYGMASRIMVEVES